MALVLDEDDVAPSVGREDRDLKRAALGPLVVVPRLGSDAADPPARLQLGPVDVHSCRSVRASLVRIGRAASGALAVP